ncbi:MAG TPA: nuclear transport factor 2 family protein [Vicinamibacterales bacterium]|nr:nuclear transport factor 2 family protein [Vicinamibacterales bacterium]
MDVCKTCVVLFVMLAAAVPPSAAQQTRRAQSDQEILIKLERDWDYAFHHQDVKFIEGVLAPEFVATYAEGQRADREKELQNAREFNQQIDSSELDEFIVRVYGDTAVVHFTQKLTGPSKGKPLTLTFRYMDVFVLRDGRWQCVASQSTRVTM